MSQREAWYKPCVKSQQISVVFVPLPLVAWQYLNYHLCEHGRPQKFSTSAINHLQGALRLLYRAERVINQNLIRKYIILFIKHAINALWTLWNYEILQPRGFQGESSNEARIMLPWHSLPKCGLWRCLFDCTVFVIMLMTWNTDYSDGHICWAWDISFSILDREGSALWLCFCYPGIWRILQI